MGFWQDIIDLISGVPHKKQDGTRVLQWEDLSKVILAHNHPYDNPAGGAQIHQITASDAIKLAGLIYDNAIKYGIDIAYIMSCMAQESAFDPQCYNKNLNKANPKYSFEATDWGLCQFNGTYLPDKDGMKGLTQEQMIAKAQDPEWAVPVFMEYMANLLVWAVKCLHDDPSLKKIGENKYFLATLAYNAGQTEALIEVRGDVVRQHPHAVAKICAEISSELGVPNVMA